MAEEQLSGVPMRDSETACLDEIVDVADAHAQQHGNLAGSQ